MSRRPIQEYACGSGRTIGVSNFDVPRTRRDDGQRRPRRDQPGSAAQITENPNISDAVNTLLRCRSHRALPVVGSLVIVDSSRYRFQELWQHSSGPRSSAFF
jgi:hypothetical protein